MSGKEKNKLSVKELIQAGGFGAIYLVVYFALAMLLGFNPITFFRDWPNCCGCIRHCIYALHRKSSEKRGNFYPFDF